MRVNLFYILLLFCLLSASCLKAQEHTLIDSTIPYKTLYEHLKKDEIKNFSSHINFQFCSSFQTSFIDKELDEASFKLNRLRLEIEGDFYKCFSYHFRYSFNQYTNPNTTDDLSSHVELACLQWKINDKLALTAGKQFLALGGYEYYVNAIKVRHFSDFVNHMPCYLSGAMLTVSPKKGQDIHLQVVNNRLEYEQPELSTLPDKAQLVKVPLMGNISWTGSFLDNSLQFYYGAAVSQIMKGKKKGYLAFGNVWERGPILAYLDCMYSREELDTKGLITGIQERVDGKFKPIIHDVQYLSWIGNFDYRVHPNVNLYVKGAYELGGVYKSGDIFQEGWHRKVWNAQFCAQYYPFRDLDLYFFLHLLYKKHNFSSQAKQIGGKNYSTQRIMLGIVYTIPVI